MMDSTKCNHERGHYARVVHAKGEHLIEMCPACKANVRGPGKWVPRSQLGLTYQQWLALPVIGQAVKDDQLTMFDEEDIP